MNARDVRRTQTEKAQQITPTRDYLSPTSLNMLAYLHVSNTSVISTPFVGHVTHNHCGARYDLVTICMLTVLRGSPKGGCCLCVCTSHRDENTSPHATACDGGICVHNTHLTAPAVQHLSLNCTRTENTQHLAVSVRKHIQYLQKTW